MIPIFHLDVPYNFWNNPQCLTKPAQFQRQRLHFDDSTALLIKSICSLLSQYLKGKSNLQNLASEVF